MQFICFFIIKIKFPLYPCQLFTAAAVKISLQKTKDKIHSLNHRQKLENHPQVIVKYRYQTNINNNPKGGL